SSRTDEAATNRGQVVQLGAATMTTGLVDHLMRGPDLLEQALQSTTISEGRLSLLEAEAEELGLSGGRVPAESLVREVLLSLSGDRELLNNHQPTAIQRRLARVAAQMSFV